MHQLLTLLALLAALNAPAQEMHMTQSTLPIPARRQVSILIYNGSVMTVADPAIIEQGVVAIQDDMIVAVGDSDLLRHYDAPVKIDATGKLVMPGLVNAHTHIPMIGFRGLGENGIRDRLFGYFFPLEKEFVTAQYVFKTSLHACIELVHGGVTTFADMYYFMDAEAAAAKQIGLRGVLGETIINYAAPDAKTPDIAIQRAVDFIERYAGDPLIIPAFGPHSPYTLADEYLRQVSDLAIQYDAPVLIHLAEIPAKENKKFDKDNIYHLADVGLLRNRLTVAHATHIDADQMQLMAAHDVGVAHNPMANAKGATGIADASAMLANGLSVGLGTDGPMSSNELTIFRVMSYAANMQRLLHQDRTIMTPPQIVRMATLGGAKALHLDGMIGSLEVGKKADLILVDLTAPNMIPHHDLYAALVYQAEPANVATVIVNGQIVLRDRELLTYSLTQDASDMAQIAAAVFDFGQTLAKKAARGE